MVRIASWVGLAALIGLGLAASPSAVRAASFDCAKAGTPTEKAICKNPAVSKLDEEVAAAFKTAQGFWPAGTWKAYILKEQRDWLSERNFDCKADAACLQQDYQRRLTYLKSPSLKWSGRYVAGHCPADGVYLDVTPRYPEAGISVMLYICPTLAGNKLLQAEGLVDASGRLSFDDGSCRRTLAFTQDVATLSGPDTERCALSVDARTFRRDPAKSPYELD